MCINTREGMLNCVLYFPLLMEEYVFFVFLVFSSIPLFAEGAGGGRIGICYGRIGTNLPKPEDAVGLILNQSINRVLIYDYNLDVIQAFARSPAEVSVSIPNMDLHAFQTESEASQWLNDYVSPFRRTVNITAVVVGTEVATTSPSLLPLLLPAMKNVHTALTKAGLDGSIRVATTNSMGVLQSSYPPSNGAFNQSLVPHYLSPLLEFLRSTGSYYLLNAYPFLAYANTPGSMSLEYALLGSDAEEMVDPGSKIGYTNLLDAQVDAVLYAMEAEGHKELSVVVSETGWPTGGGGAANAKNAEAYNNNLIRRILHGGGTPHRPDTPLDAYIFSLFNENRKTGSDWERNWGIYAANMTPMYTLDLTGTRTSSGTNDNSTNAKMNSNSTTPTWCIASSSASNASLAAGMDWACGQANINCGAIQDNGSCFNPNTYGNHASYAYNTYYQQNGNNPAACNFSGTAIITNTNPSYGSCIFTTLSSGSGSSSIVAQGPSAGSSIDGASSSRSARVLPLFQHHSAAGFAIFCFFFAFFHNT